MSVNGRPFKPDPTSYQMTGIPVGNPKRYMSRGVIRMCPNPSVPFENQQVGIPGKGTVTEAEREFKRLLDNQLDVSDAVAQRKVKFTSAINIETPPSAKGFTTLHKYQQMDKSDQRAKELKNLGFTDVQISHILTEEGMEVLENGKKRKFVPHPMYVQQGVTEAQELMEKKLMELAEEEENNKVKMSRHMLELEASLLQGKTHVPLAHAYLKQLQKASPPSTPTEEELAANHANGNEHNNNSANGTDTPSSSENATPQPVVIKNKIDSIPSSTIESNRLSEDEIRKLPQFASYERGTPSKVLYVKNLEKSVTAEDLVSIFIRFQEEGKEKIGFKLMNGKMKGQAFITFPDENTATTAMELVNGFVFKGKPIVICYGKGK